MRSPIHQSPPPPPVTRGSIPIPRWGLILGATPVLLFVLLAIPLLYSQISGQTNTAPDILIDDLSAEFRSVPPGGSLTFDLRDPQYVYDPDPNTNLGCSVSPYSDPNDTATLADPTTHNVSYATGDCTITFTPGQAGWGSDTFTVLITDRIEAVTADVVIWQNTPPTLDPPYDVNINRRWTIGVRYQWDGLDDAFFSEADEGDALTYTVLDAEPDDAIVISTSQYWGTTHAYFTPPKVNGPTSAKLCGTDKAMAKICMNINIDWSGNSAPEIRTDDLPKSVATGSTLVVDLRQSQYVTDPDPVKTRTCRLSRNSDDTTENVQYTTNGCTITFTPGTIGWGSDLFDLRVSDQQEATDETIYTVFHNNPPELTNENRDSEERDVTEGTYTTDVSTFFTDIDTDSGDTLRYSLGTITPEDLTPDLTGSTLSVTTPTSNQTHTIQICAQDSATEETCEELQIQWVGYSPPDILIDQKPQSELVVTADGTLTLNLSGSEYVTDPDNTADTLTCALTRQPTDTTQNVSFNANGCTIIFEPETAGWGPDEFSLTITDDNGGSDTATFTIWQNNPPIIIGNTIPTITQKYQDGNHEIDLTNHFTDPDTGDTLDFTLGTLNPTTLNPNLTGNTLTASAPTSAETHTIQICAQDDATQETCGLFTIDWITNQPPQLIQGTADQPISIERTPGANEQLQITDYYQDPDNPNTDLTWILTPITGTTDQTVATVEIDPNNPKQLNIQPLNLGQTTYHLAASDTIDTSPNQRLQITVTTTTNPGPNPTTPPTTPPSTQPTTPPSTQPTTQPTTNTQPTTGGGGNSFIPNAQPGPNPGVGPSTGPTSQPTGNPTSSFIDTIGNTHETNINQLANQGISRGCNPPTNNRYCPDRSVTRAEMATFLVRAFNLPTTQTGQFDDTEGNTHQTNIETLAANQITSGCNPPDNTRYCPDRPVTRAQMATFLARTLELTEGSGDFTDTTNSVHQNDINRIATAGITRGCNPPDNTRYCPDRPVTRAEMATFLTRAQNLP